MSNAETVKRAAATLGECIERRDWTAADRRIEYLVGAWLRSPSRGQDAVEAAALVSELQLNLVADFDVDQTIGPEQIAWMLAGVLTVISQAAVPSELTMGDTRTRMLEMLCLAGEPLITKELARRVGRAEATVGRELPKLRGMGLIKSVSAGRTVLNEITPLGQREYELAGEPPTVWPTTLRKTVEVIVEAMDVVDIADPVMTNDVNDLLHMPEPSPALV